MDYQSQVFIAHHSNLVSDPFTKFLSDCLPPT